MSHLWQRLLEYLWPSRIDPAVSHARRMMFLQMVIAFAIMVAAGPEIVAAMEMTTLLEMLGASLFLTAYGAGAKLAAIALWRGVYSIAIPTAQMSVMRSDAPTGLKALIVVYVAASATGCLMAAFVVCSYGQHLLDLAT